VAGAVPGRPAQARGGPEDDVTEELVRTGSTIGGIAATTDPTVGRAYGLASLATVLVSRRCGGTA
jgi:hypothetical protein